MDYSELISGPSTGIRPCQYKVNSRLLCLHIDINSKGNGTVVRSQTGPMSQEKLPDWLSKSETLGQKAFGGLRLIMGPCTTDESQDGNFEFPHDSREMKRVEPVSLDVPFTEENFERVRQVFWLPKATPWAILTRYRHFHKHTIHSSKPTVGFTMRLPTRRNTPINLALSMSYDATTCLTRAILIGLSREQGQRIKEQLIALSNYSFHPLLLPTLTSCHHELLLHDLVQNLYSGLLYIEKLSRQTTVPSPDFSLTPETDIGDSVMTTRALSIAQVALPSESETEGLIQGIELIRKSVQDVDRLFATLSTEPEHLVRVKTSEAAAKLIDYLDCCSTGAHIALWDFGFLAKRSDALMNAIYSYTARETAIATKQDSAAMKTIALLTILFLPATFFAALFAMPLFDFTVPLGQSVIRDRFWMYWALTAPVTLILLTVYITFIKWHNKVGARKQQAAFRQGQVDDIKEHSIKYGASTEGIKDKAGKSTSFLCSLNLHTGHRRRQTRGIV